MSQSPNFVKTDQTAHTAALPVQRHRSKSLSDLPKLGVREEIADDQKTFV